MHPSGSSAPAKLSEDEAAYTLASLLAGSDGVVTHAETRRVEGEWLRYASSRGLAAGQARAIAAHCRELRAKVGAPAMMVACEKALRRGPHGQDAVRMALRVAYADGRPAAAEKASLERILALVGLHADELPGAAATVRKND